MSLPDDPMRVVGLQGLLAQLDAAAPTPFIEAGEPTGKELAERTHERKELGAEPTARQPQPPSQQQQQQQALLPAGRPVAARKPQRLSRSAGGSRSASSLKS